MDKQTAINIYANALDKYCVEGTRRYREWLINSKSREAYFIRYRLENETEETPENCYVSFTDWYSMLTEEEREEYSKTSREMDKVYCWLKSNYLSQINEEQINKSCSIERRNWYDIRY